MKYRILGLVRQDATSYHRVKLAFLSIHDKPIKIEGKEHIIEVKFVNPGVKLTDDFISEFDLIVSAGLIPIDISRLAMWKVKFGTKFILDINEDFGDNEELKRQIIFADSLTTPNDTLRLLLRAYNDSVSLIPNWLPFDVGQFTDKKLPSDKIRIGLYDNPIPVHEYLTLKNVLKRLFVDPEIQEKCEFVVVGQDLEVIKMFQDFKGTLRVIDAPPLENYMSAYEHIDILLSPMMDNSKNRLKTGLKIFEAACKDIPVVGSKLYSDFDIDYYYPVYQAHDWSSKLRSLIRNNHYKECGRMIGDYYRGQHDYQDLSIQRICVLEQMYHPSAYRRKSQIDMYGIVYEGSHDTEFFRYTNMNTLPEEFSHYFEYNCIGELLGRRLEKDYVGIVDHEFINKTKLTKKHIDWLASNSPGYDVYGLSKHDYNGNLLARTEEEHPGFATIFTKLCKKLMLKVKEPERIVLSNYFVANAYIYRRYVLDCLTAAIEYMESISEIKELCWKRVDLRDGLPVEELKKRFGMEHHTFHKLILDRLFPVWLENNTHITFKQLI